MRKHLRRLGGLLALSAVASLGGCQIFGVAAGLLNYLIPIAAGVGGSVLVWYLTKD